MAVYTKTTWTAGSTALSKTNMDHLETQAECVLSGDMPFTGFPVTPSAAPDADYEIGNKKYTDEAPAASAVIGHATHVHPASETTILTVTVPQAGGILTYRGTFYAICSGGGPSTMRWRFRDAADALVTMYGNYQYGSASTPGPFGRGAIATSSLDILAGAQDAQGHFVVSLKPAAAGSYRITIEDVGDLSDGSTGGAVTAVWHC